MAKTLEQRAKEKAKRMMKNINQMAAQKKRATLSENKSIVHLKGNQSNKPICGTRGKSFNFHFESEVLEKCKRCQLKLRPN